MFKTDIDLSNIQGSPYVYHDTEGHFQWDFWNYATTEHVTFIFEDTNYPTWLLNTFLVGAAVVAITLILALPAGYARGWQARGADRRRRHLPGLPHPADASLPPAFPDRDQPRPEGLVVGADPRVPVLHDPVRDVASHGVLQDDSAGARGRRARRRLLETEGVLPDRPSDFAAGHPHRRHLRVLPLCQRVRAFTFISSSEQRTVSAGVPNDLIRGDIFFWQSLLAATLIPAIPLALLYNAFLDRFIKGFTGGAFR